MTTHRTALYSPPKVFSLLIIFLLVFAAGARADDALKARQMVEKARLLVESWEADPDIDTTWHEMLRHSYGVLILPQILKGGLVFGGSGGSGVLLARDPASREWSGPVFYRMSAVSFGLQAGAKAAETVIIVRTERGLNRLLNSSVKLGGDVSVAAGPVGEGIGAADIAADLVVFARTKGAYAGMSLEGSLVKVRGKWNRAFYGEPLTATSILRQDMVHSEPVDKLVAKLLDLAGPPTT